MKSSSFPVEKMPYSPHIRLVQRIVDTKYGSWILSGSTGAFWYVLNFVWPTPGLLEYGKGKMFPDMMPTGYDMAYVSSLLSQYDVAGRAFYRNFLLTGDVLFPICYSLFFGMIVWYCVRNVRISTRWKWALISLSFIAAIFDYLENIAMLWNLFSYPQISNWAILLGSMFTVIKNVFSIIGVFTIAGF